jgi:hypothetical protein
MAKNYYKNTTMGRFFENYSLKIEIYFFVVIYEVVFKTSSELLCVLFKEVGYKGTFYENFQ